MTMNAWFAGKIPLKTKAFCLVLSYQSWHHIPFVRSGRGLERLFVYLISPSLFVHIKHIKALVDLHSDSTASSLVAVAHFEALS